MASELYFFYGIGLLCSKRSPKRMIMKQDKLREDLCNALKAYIDAFCVKHDSKHDFSVGDDLMDVAFISDMWLSIHDVISDIDESLPVGVISDWYYDSLENHVNGVACENLLSYFMINKDKY